MRISLIYTTARKHLIEEVKERFDSASSEKAHEWVITTSDDYDTCVKGWNAAALQATGDILVQVSDDLFPPQNWDTEIKRYITEPNTVLHLLDDRGEVSCIFHPILTKDIVDKLGYMYPPDFESMFCDNWIFWYAFKECNFVRPHKVFWKHVHRTTHKEVELDEVGAKHESQDRYIKGQEVFTELMRGMGYAI